MKISSKKIAYTGILSGLTIALSTIDNAIPLPLPLGAKIGFGNLTVMYSLFSNDVKTSYILTILKGLFSGFRGFTAMVNSLCGGLLSLTIMMLLYKKTKLSYITISVFGGVFHNIGQLISAMVIMQSFSLITLSPILILIGCISGFAMGILVSRLKERL
ncbi:MAG: Gx transporter family protein [Oscillospiraceae bacterium]